MRIIVLLSLFLCLFNCEDKQSKSKAKDTTTVKKQAKKIKDTITKKAEEFPLLDSKMAMEFFLQYDTENKENKVRISTDYGDIDILLFNETKFHRSNFIYLTKRHYFDNTQFFRVINNFMIQGGNGDDMATAIKRRKIGKYLLPRDTNRGFKHDRGTVSMPSSDIENPHKLASPYQFFIVQQNGGAHHLNGDYTVFGKVIKGMDVVDKIAAVKTDEADWPLKNVFIKKVEILE
ncbi:peptidylprolyl isomerase [Hyunsoonleella pacifica]|uniref:peptidylprolyl isomerase n=1 Tax=Hyunsoonleella pacifica TaxID=1080224 RepID=A0A4Q9FJ41_9FLAO|nr:peptidylprolyl isomerase [Hyunsoonleella pacifica]TBN13028.1 peptidylprolyl isomerase [Hyunsoonleella pacifica]GGD27746.1 peptidyl-prolyl cis-trans isomerase [Hyunsoonleella pacifica]